ncbi:putative pentatricopeptide repeat-containing protein [Citrus sinensis]|uniref:putative pentatricopeptide repeat-containing protein At1g31840 n=1 Tax=Citrus sinensis TaxID=2711 RepID=UPI000D6299D6|nr:putative pentatricopeptide repeat-containing protein At1g31840 [Citrus sinensis]KAH9671076.1 putative pentatricopeptide repeat-containing protein [Citrus sinensis]
MLSSWPCSSSKVLLKFKNLLTVWRSINKCYCSESKTHISDLQFNQANAILANLIKTNNPTPAIQFFKWTHNCVSSPNIAQLIHVLLQSDMRDVASHVFDKMVIQFGKTYNFFRLFRDSLGDFGCDYSFLIENYVRIGKIDESVEIFAYMSDMGIYLSPDLVQRLMSCLVDSNSVGLLADQYYKLCRAMRGKGFCVYEFLMNGLLRKGVIENAFHMHRQVIQRGFVPNIVTCYKILKRLCINGQIGNASSLFDVLLLVGPKPNVVTFSTLINAFCKKAKLEKAFQLYNLMMEMDLVPDLIIYSILIDGLFKAGRLKEGNELLLTALDRGLKLDVVVFSSVMDAYVGIGDVGRAVQTYDRMLNEGFLPNVISYSILIKGLCQQGRLVEACGLFGQVLIRGLEPSLLTYSSLIDGFCKSGKLRDGFSLYDNMIKRGLKPDAVVCSLLINDLCKQGLMGDIKYQQHSHYNYYIS